MKFIKVLAFVTTVFATSAESASKPQNPVEGDVTVRRLKSSISIQIGGDKLVEAMLNHLKGVDGVISGEDGDNYYSKSTDDISCGGRTSSLDADDLELEEPSCVIEFSPYGRVVGQSNDPFAWANASAKEGPEKVYVTFENEVMTISVERFATAGLIYNELKLKEVGVDDDVFIKKGKNLSCRDDETDGSEVECRFKVNQDGQVL